MDNGGDITSIFGFVHLLRVDPEEYKKDGKEKQVQEK